MKIIHKGGLLPLLYLGLAPAAVAQDAGESVTLPEVSVSAPADTAFFAPDTASQGVVTGKEIEEQPRSRVGEVLEVVPGLIATQHRSALCITARALISPISAISTPPGQCRSITWTRCPTTSHWRPPARSAITAGSVRCRALRAPATSWPRQNMCTPMDRGRSRT